MAEETAKPTKTPPAVTPMDMSTPTSTISNTSSNPSSNYNNNNNNSNFAPRQNNNNTSNYNNYNNRNRSYNGSRQSYSKNFNNSNSSNNTYNHSYNKNSPNGYSRYTNVKSRSNSYNNSTYTSPKNNTNRFNNGSRFNNLQYYNSNNNGNNTSPNMIISGSEDMMNQPQTSMAWSGYYIPQMYYIPQQMAAVATAMVSASSNNTKNNRGQTDLSENNSNNSSNTSSHAVSPQLNGASLNSTVPTVRSSKASHLMSNNNNNNNNINANIQNISPNNLPSPGLSNSTSFASPPKKTTIEITTKSGQKLDLNQIHNQYKLSSSSGTNNRKDCNSDSIVSEYEKKDTNATNDDAHNTETNKDMQDVESEAEKNKKAFLEQVRLRKLEMDKKKQLESQPHPETKSNEIENDLTQDDEKFELTEDSQVEEGNKLEEQESEHVMTFAERMKLKKRTQEIEHTNSNITNSSNREISNKSDITTEVDSNQSHEKQEDAVTKSFDDSETNKDISVLQANQETITNDESNDDDNDNRMSITEFMEKIKNADPIDDIYSFKYPEDIEAPSEKYKKLHLKYTYGPTFLLQFKDKINCKPDREWSEATESKIVILPTMAKQRTRVNFAGGSENTRAGSSRNLESRANSRVNPKRQLSKRGDDRRSNRPTYTPRRERMENPSRHDTRRESMNMPPQEKLEQPKEEVAPLVPSANRWVPKFKAKKTEKTLAPDGVTELLDSEEVQRKMKSLLNKLTLEKFDPISTDIINIANQSQWETNGETLRSVIEQIFLKACDEPYWSSMYAQLCGKIVKDLKTEISDENNTGKSGPKLVLHYLVVRCHTEFEKGWTDKLPTNPDGSPLEPEMMSDEYYALAAAKRRGLGLVRFIGFLYRLNLLTGKMMFECFRRLMKDLTENVSEETLESLVELLTTVGEQFENDSFSTGKGTLEGSVLFDKLFQLIQSIIDEGKICNRVKFKLIDVKELREDKHWNSEKANQGPKTIQQIHEEEEKARQEKITSSRAPSRRTNTSNYNRSERSGGFKRDMSRDNFNNNYYSSNTISSNYSNRNSQFSNVGGTQRYNTRNIIKEEKPAPAQPINRFDALLHATGDE